MNSVFDEARDRVSALEAGSLYGLTIHYNKALCPWHDDHTPSLSFRGNRCKCFSCGVSGSSIDLTAQLLGLSPIDAVKRLDADFSLGLDLDRKPDPAAVQERKEMLDEYRAFETWRESFIRDLCRVHRRAHIALIASRELTDTEADAVRHMAEAEYFADLLSNGSATEQAAVYRDRGLIGKWTSRALQN